MTKKLFSSASGDLAVAGAPWRQTGRSAPTNSPQITHASHLSSRPNLAFLRGRFGVAALSPASLRLFKLLNLPSAATSTSGTFPTAHPICPSGRTRTPISWFQP